MTLRHVLSGEAGSTHRSARAHLVRTGVLLAGVSLVLAACAEPAEERAQAVLAGAATQDSPAAPDAAGDPQIDPMPSDGETPSGTGSWDAATTEVCAAAVEPGFEQVAQSADDRGVTSFWSSGRSWVLCDVAEGADPVLLESAPGRRALDETALAVATTEVGDGAVRVVAGGRLPWPVEELTYTFPDGHTEKARFVTGRGAPGEAWWSVVYTATDGVLVDAGTNEDLEPVTISVVGAAAEAFRLAWADLQRSE
jgi:hypothetical protein